MELGGRGGRYLAGAWVLRGALNGRDFEDPLSTDPGVEQGENNLCQVLVELSVPTQPATSKAFGALF